MGGDVAPQDPTVGYPGAGAFLDALAVAGPNDWIYAAVGSPPSTPNIEFAFPSKSVTITGVDIPTPPPTYAVPKWTTDVLRVRDAPTTSGKVLGSIPKGTRIQVLASGQQVANGYTWWKVIGGTPTLGWVAGAYLTDIIPP